MPRIAFVDRAEERTLERAVGVGRRTTVPPYRHHFPLSGIIQTPWENRFPGARSSGPRVLLVHSRL